MHAPLRERFRDLPEADMKEILHNRMWESKAYQTHEDHMSLYEALKKSMARDNRDQLLSDLAKARKKKKKRQGSPKTLSSSPPHPPPPPPPPAGPSRTLRAFGASGSSQLPPPPPPPSNTQGGQSISIAALSSSKTAASAEYMAWTMTDTRIKPSISPIPEELHMGDDTTADEPAYSSSDRPATPEPTWSILSSDLTIPTNNWASAIKSTYTPPLENSLLAQIGDMTTFMNWYCKKQGISELTQQDLEGPAYEYVKVFHPDVMWIEEECKYERRLAMMGISHGGSKTTDSYIDRHTSARNWVTAYAVRITWLIADIEDKYHGPNNLEKEIKVTCYTGVGFETDKEDRKSQSRYVFLQNGGALHWKSTKQSTIAMSYTDAK
ncbi:hypothetical protein Tco_0211960 [Tanacetum coccineum]